MWFMRNIGANCLNLWDGRSDRMVDQIVLQYCGGGGEEYAYSDRIDRDRKFLFGFSDGATEGIELMCTGKFVTGVFAVYGFTRVLPQLALDRLKDLPIWMYMQVQYDCVLLINSFYK